MTTLDDLKSAELLSWVDVARRLSYVASTGAADSPPEGVISSAAFWSGLAVRLTQDADEAAVRSWLQRVFGTWLVDPLCKGLRLRLDAPDGMAELPIRLVRLTGDETHVPIFRPHASLEGERYFRVRFPERPKAPRPPIFAFHSVKGGVGRTTAAIVFALDPNGRRDSRPVLLIDADFEAPGISFLLRSRKASSTISLEDLLALAHADRTENFSATLDFVAQRMADQRIDGLYVLPAKRLLEDLAGFAIRPENLLSARRDNPYVVVDLVRELAALLNCRLVVVDLRAGLVDVSVQFLTDPSVERVFVSTAGGQSVAALNSMVSTLGLIERQTGTHGRQPFVLFNQLPIYRIADGSFRGELAKGVLTHAETSFLPRNLDQDTGESAVTFGFIPHLTDLIATAGDWDSYLRELATTNFHRLLADAMRGWSGIDSLNLQFADFIGPSTIDDVSDHNEQCRRLQEFAERLEVAETAEGIPQPLVTPPLQRLASDFLSQVPVVVIEGPKGTGKTLTARYLLECENWRDAVNKLDRTLQCSFEGPFLPLFGSVASNESMLTLISAARERLATALGGDDPRRLSDTEQALKARLDQGDNAVTWLDFWLTEIAAAGGFIGLDGWSQFVASVRRVGNRPVIVVEGLEEVLTDPFLNTTQAAALLSLLREVPLRLREEAGRPIGFVALVRADMVEATIAQNLAQFRAGYANYALTWRDVDIKELVVWLVSNSGAIPGLWSNSWRRDKTPEDQEQDLRKIWGLKLGSDDSREARSTEWVISVLTDLTGRLTARDLVRFIGTAAKGSRGQPSPDRLLSARALKDAVDRTSRMKVEEYPKEVRQLGSIFAKFTKHPGFETPFNRAMALQIGVDESELDILEKYGVAYQEDGIFEVPELFRIGLEMRRGGARPNIISLTRRARERARA